MDPLGKPPPNSEITPETLYLRRREFIRNALLFTATSAGVGGSLLWLTQGRRASERRSRSSAANPAGAGRLCGDPGDVAGDSGRRQLALAAGTVAVRAYGPHVPFPRPQDATTAFSTMLLGGVM